MLFEVGFEAGQAQGQVELIGGSQAQAGDADRLGTAGADGQEHRLVMVIVIDSQALEGAKRKLLEEDAARSSTGPWLCRR